MDIGEIAEKAVRDVDRHNALAITSARLREAYSEYGRLLWHGNGASVELQEGKKTAS